jgi:hypothetical protein
MILSIKSMTQCSACVYSVTIPSQMSPAVCTVCLDYSKQNTLSSWQNSWPVFYLTGRWHVSQNTRKTLFRACMLFYTVCTELFSPSAAIGPSLTSSFYLGISSSQIGIGRRKKHSVFQILIPSWRIVATFIVLKTPVTGKYGWQNLELVASSNHFVCLREKERYIIRW